MTAKEFNFDDYAPSDMAKRAESAATKKANLSFLSLFMLAVLAGGFIALGAEFYTMVIFDSGLSVGLTKLIGGLTFSLGLVLVIIAGAELFTGNNLIVMGFASGIVTYKQLLKNWGVSYLGNFIGAVAIGLLVYISNIWTIGDYLLGAKALSIAASKVNLTFLEAFSRGILCNMLVCLAVWLCFSARSVVSKVAAIIFPITAFVASGFEHSIANMYFIPFGMLLKNNSKVLEAFKSIAPNSNLSNLNISGFLGNLIPVTLGNIIGGAILVGVVYWIIIVYPEKKAESSKDAS